MVVIYVYTTYTYGGVQSNTVTMWNCNIFVSANFKAIYQVYGIIWNYLITSDSRSHVRTASSTFVHDWANSVTCNLVFKSRPISFLALLHLHLSLDWLLPCT